LEQKSQQLAKTDQKGAQAQEDKEDAEASLSADQKFLAELTAKCAMSDGEWETRQKARQVEMQAVAKAVSILSSDDARDQFSKTFNANFLQLRAAQRSDSRREKAAQVLSTLALKAPQLAALAISVKLDPFTKVHAAIDKMVAALVKEKAEEIKHKDYCVDEFHTNEQNTQKKTHAKINLEAKKADLSQTIKEAKSAIAVVQAEIDDLNLQVKRAGEDRAAEKKVFDGVIADQRATQGLLQSALKALKDVYGDGVVLLQKQEPPAGFSEYKKSTGSTGVIALINQIIADAKEMEAEATHDEETAVEEHAKFVKTSREGLKAKDDAKVDLKAQKAKAEGDLAKAKSEFEGTVTDLENLANSAGALHKSCDYTLKNFDVRQEARDEEVNALRQAKAILSGMTA